MSQKDTIVALSSAAPLPNAASGIPRAILRLSGRDAVTLGERIFDSRERLSGVRGWRRIGGQTRWKSRGFPACAYVMRAPKSYTREDVLEIHCSGLRWHVDGLLDELLRHGARLALPGEFTRRAVENGRIHAEQAEAIGALIQAQDASEARVHAARLNGRAAKERVHLREKIEELLSLVELGLDFATEDVTVLSLDEMLKRTTALRGACEALAGGAHAANETHRENAGLPRVLLLGPTNAGKSTLFNALLKRDAAIVSAERHTTRDTVEAACDFQSVQALLIDSAGAGREFATQQRGALADESSGSEFLRQAAWNATLHAIRSADVVLVLLDAANPEGSAHDAAILREELEQGRPAALALVWTKSDLAPTSNECAGLTDHAPLKDAPRFHISAQTGAGVAELKTFVHARLQEIGSRPRDAYLAALAAARHAATKAAEALARAEEALKARHGEDVVAVELREAVHAFWQAEGVLIRHDAVTEAALDRIFSSFCIGK